MNLSHLSRPSILCQCSRCSSSVAACENEWARLSDTYSTVTGWLSIDMNRINISSEKKQIPQSSELEFVQGRVVQDIVCRLCHQKLGGLVHLETDAKVFWKLSKMSFREIISMRESNPLFVKGSLSWLLAPVEQTIPLNEPASNASLPTSRSEAVLSQTLYNQGASLNKISNTVEELHDTMSDLKQSFRALQLELNTTPSARNSEYHGDEAMDMLRTVLKELQHKSDEIEKLKLENESLKLKAKYWQGRPMGGAPTTPRVLEHAMPEVQSPGFLNDSGRRGLISGSTQLQITHSFDREHEHTGMEHTASNEVVQYETAPVKVPLKPAAEILPEAQRLLQREGLDATTGSRRRRESGEPATKRPRLALTEDPESSESNVDVESNPPPKKRGRPSSRKSLQATMRTPQTQSVSNPAASTNADAETELPTTEDRPVDAPDKTDTQPRRKSRKGRSRTITSRSTSQPASRPPSLSPRLTRGGTKLNDEDTTAATKPTDKPSLENELPNRSAGFEIAVNVAELTPESVANEDYLFARIQQKQDQSGKKNSEANEQRQAKVAAREMIVKAAMEREEAMADG
ncbi:Hypothetical protein PENO1_050320 [Penicillium occitanis (nom. inval.)]|nr:Hypothetical protein PENO1_050320 [Penicillium occitanis (nom. inval.)]PCH01780.1 hypothetical protein PENOC_046740 [Penicillium occitanis (nom. inval.)]